MSLKRSIPIFCLIGFLVVVFEISFLRINAKDLDSNNYRLKDVKISVSSDKLDSGNHKVLINMGSGIDTKGLNSVNFSLGVGQANTWMVHTPLVKCFETQTNGSSNCEHLPSGYGMVQVCGESGCYDKARFEIDAQGNPSDTLYAVLLTDDNWNTVYYLDGDTHTLKTASTHDITDYRTETQWEIADGSIDWSKANILGLMPGKTYKLRVVAFHGMFTEGFLSPEATATTALPTIKFDLDTGTSDTTESDPPYSLKIPAVYPGSVASSSDFLFLDISSNIPVKVEVKDANNGLLDATTSHLIPAYSGDLDSATEGVGLKILSLTEDTGPGVIAAASKYNGAGVNEVGDVVVSNSLFVCSFAESGHTCEENVEKAPVYNARVKTVLKLKVANSTPVGEYSDTLTFYAMPAW